jgi:hypothetical protein
MFTSILKKSLFKLLLGLLLAGLFGCSNDEVEDLDILNQHFDYQIDDQSITLSTWDPCSQVFLSYEDQRNTTEGDLSIRVSGQDCIFGNILEFRLDSLPGIGVYDMRDQGRESFYFNRKARNNDSLGLHPTSYYYYRPLSGYFQLEELSQVKIEGRWYRWLEASFEVQFVNPGGLIISLTDGNIILLR